MNRNKYYKKYMLDRYYSRTNWAKDKLGGKCSKCGSIENLEIDHINRKEKSFNVSKGWSLKEETFKKEIEKCQLLCTKCHIEKTHVDLNRLSARETHGTLSSYRYCKCALCREAKNLYMKEYRIKNPRKN